MEVGIIIFLVIAMLLIGIKEYKEEKRIQKESEEKIKKIIEDLETGIQNNYKKLETEIKKILEEDTEVYRKNRITDEN